jgi:dipeptidyl aminopeptidase/acylaminoacyl peptidase
MGSSYGGYAALWAPIRKPDRYRCAIAFAAPTDMEAMMYHDISLFAAPRYFREYRDLIRGDPPIDLDTISPLQNAGRMTVPVLIAHGELDDRVPIDQARRMAAALHRGGAVVETDFYPLEGHGFDRASDLLDYFQHVAAFLARYDPASAVAVGHPAR